MAQKDLHTRLAKELKGLAASLRSKDLKTIQKRLQRVLRLASAIGGSVGIDAERLKGDIAQFLAHPSDPQINAALRDHALRLEQETKEI